MSIAEQITNYNNGLLASYQAVREKQGAVPANKNFVNLPYAIRSIEGGSGMDFFPFADYVRFQGNKNMPENVTLNLDNASTMANIFSQTNVTKATLNNLGNVTNLTQSFSACAELTEINLNGLSSKATTFNQSFANCTKLSTINGTLDFTRVTNVSSAFGGCYQLRNIEFSENTLSVNLSLSNSRYLTDESLVSVANSLVSGSHTLTLHADSKALCNTIKGTIDNSKGRAEFVKDYAGTVTLTEFITVTKGWTMT